ncbi:MAG: 2-C-methyl-D-erythritol 2,4-cyclodiphosphate synthase, partial [Desulfobacteraceae bacterium]|nr:2-C-methyl-D-erythritol 2,4-cyclodiphosphate synthase [Desulfobacteraceae bacterium]
PAFKDIHSIKLLVKTCEMISKKGFKINNVDSTIFAQEPKIAPYKEAMRKNIAQAIEIEPARINIKATTTEGLGMIGEGDGIGAMCIVLINR